MIRRPPRSTHCISSAASDVYKRQKDNALQKIESHEKLCRIMQKQTHDKIHKIETQISRLEKIVLVSAGMLIMGMANMIFMLLSNTQ